MEQKNRGTYMMQPACPRHKKPLLLFCRNDETLICMVCNWAVEHRGHYVLPIDEVASEYQDRFEALQQSLEKKKTTAIEWKLAEEEKKQTFLTQIKLEKDEIRSVFKEMKKCIKTKERVWLNQLSEMENETEKSWEENITRLSEEIGRLNTLISEMEKKRQQPPIKLLQDIGSTLKRYQEGQLRHVVDLFPRPEKRLRSYSQKRPALLKAMETFDENLKETFPKDSAKEAQNKVNVILDPDTAHPFLILTEGLTSVKWEDRYQDLPDCHTRFNREFCVLGQERFASERHWWEVEVEEEKGAMWALGVARESVRRKGIFKFTPNEGIWAVGKRPYDSPSPCRLSVLNSPEWVPLNLSHEPRNIRVSLDFEEGRLVFLDADTNKLIFAFSSVDFRGERIQPFFWVGSGVQLNL
nr:tripartite motif-containing protein 10-like isoform X2 [Anolis sagrei ordinatus]